MTDPESSSSQSSPHRLPVLDEAGHALVLWRGESSANLFTAFDLNKTRAKVGFFFAEQKELAAGYAGFKTQPRAFTLHAERVLDLTDAYAPGIRSFLADYAAEFDEWVDRRGGEEMGVHDFLEAGSLYDYEGTGYATRWNALFRAAWDGGYDAVKVHDSTDGIPMGVVWVAKNPEQITFIPAPALDLPPSEPATTRRRMGF